VSQGETTGMPTSVDKFLPGRSWQLYYWSEDVAKLPTGTFRILEKS